MKPRPELLERYELAASEQDAFPLDWPTVFGRKAPLAVEIGYGGGEYLAWWAANRPEWDFVGIELPPESVMRAAPQFAAQGLSNVRLLRGDARYLLRELFGTGTLERVLMQFPMPWPKEKHAKHRVYSPDFAASLAARCSQVCTAALCPETVQTSHHHSDDDWPLHRMPSPASA